MAIYRPPKPRWPLAVGVGIVCLLIGMGIGALLGGGDPDPSEFAGDLTAELIAAAGSLEVAEIEYAESVSNGEVTKETEYEGSLAAVASSEDRYRAVAPAIELLASDRAGEIVALYDECEDSMRDLADPDEVERCLGELTTLLEGE